MDDPLKSNTMQERTTTCIASHPCRGQGWWFYNLFTKRLIRSQCIVNVMQNQNIFRALTEERVLERHKLKIL